MREPLIEGADEEDQPTWNIWEYDVPGARQLRRVIPSDIIAEEGHDVAPHYLPDGRIVFASTRQRQARAILLDEGKPQFAAQDEDRREPAFVLHVMDADGSDIHQISFNQSHDLEPAVLDDGRIVFSRWDHAGPQSEIHLYAMRPDGSDLELLYGAQSHMTGTDGSEVQFLDPRPMANGEVLVRAQPFSAEDFGGQLLTIDTVNYVEDTQANLANSGALSGPAQKLATPNQVLTIPGPSPGGRYSSAYPLRDGTGRLLVSWNQCRLLDGERIIPCTEDLLEAGTLPAAPPLYGIWMYDPRDETQLPVVTPTEGWIYTDAVALQALTPPPVLLDRVAGLDFDAELATEGVGILDIRSVYDFDGADIAPAGIAALADPALTTAAERPARFLRIEKAVSLPDEDVRDFTGTAFGVTAAFGMREILGYVMVEPDGSVRTKCPPTCRSRSRCSTQTVTASGRATTTGCRCVRARSCAATGATIRAADFRMVARICSTPLTTARRPPASHFPTATRRSSRIQARRWRRCGRGSAARPIAQRSCPGSTSCSTTCGPTRSPRTAHPIRASRTATPICRRQRRPAPTARRAGARAAGRRSTTRSHIHPLWSKPRVTLAADGVTVLADDTCTTCHTGVTAAAATCDLGRWRVRCRTRALQCISGAARDR